MAYYELKEHVFAHFKVLDLIYNKSAVLILQAQDVDFDISASPIN